MEKVSVLLNPSSGKNRSIDKKDLIEKKLTDYGIPHDLFVTESESHLKELSKKYSRKSSAIVGVGGDSTFTIIINEMLKSRSRATLGMIGLGSSDDLVKEFNISTIDESCRAIREGRVKKIDLGKISSGKKIIQYFPGQANIGIGVSVNRYMDGITGRYKGLNKIQALMGLIAIKSAFKTREVPLHLSLRFPGKKIEGNFISVLFTNIKYWASGKLFAPNARADDGLLDCILVKGCSLANFIRIALASGKGHHVKKKEVLQLQSPRFSVSGPEPFHLQVDGEILKDKSGELSFRKLNISILKKSLSIFS